MSDTVRLAGEDDLFFADAIHAQVANPRFLRRSWLADGVQDHLDEPDCRYVILVAEPGAGKSAFMTQLADDHHDWLRYFYRRDQRSPLGRPGIRPLLLRLGLQLATNRPELFSTEQLRISVDQRVGHVENRGSVVAAEVNRLLASPFHQTVIDIRQTIGSGGTVAGLRVAEWVTDPLLLDVDDLAVMALLDPARALQRADPDTRLVVLIDAVDEVSSRPDDNLIDWISGLAVPPNVRLLLSSRPDPSLQLLAERQPDAVRLVHLTDDPHNIDDIRAFATVLGDGLPVEALPEGIDTATLIGELVSKADGNLGYLAAVARTVDQAQADGENPEALGELVDPARLPDDIQGIYALFLHRIRSGPGERDLRLTDPGTGRAVFVTAWAELYRPILETLCVSREPLTVEQLLALTGTLASVDDVQTAIRNLGQFLGRLGGACSLYHATVAEFMLDPATRADPATADIAVDGITAHRRIASILRRNLDEIWRDDPGVVEQARRSYARRYLVPHLVDGVLWDELHTLLITSTWGSGKLLWDPSTAELCADLDAGRCAAGQRDLALDEAERRLPDLWAFSAVRTSLSSVADRLPTDGFALLALQGKRDEASRLAGLVTDPSRRVAVLSRMIATAARATRADDGAATASDRSAFGADANDLALRALTAIEQIAVDRSQRLAFLMVADACQELATCGEPLEVAVRERLEALASGLPGEADQVAALCRLVRVYDAGGDTAAVDEVLDRILRTAREASTQADACWGLAAHILAELGRLAEAAEATQHLQSDPFAWLEALKALIAASPPEDLPGGVAEVLESMHAWALRDATPDIQCHILVGLADAYGTAFPAEASVCTLQAGDALRLTQRDRWTVPAVAKAMDLYGPPGAADVFLEDLAEAAAQEVETHPSVPGHGYTFHNREVDLAEGLAQANRVAALHRVTAALSAHERGGPLRTAAVACARGGRWDEARALIEEEEASQTHLSVTFTSDGGPLPALFPPAGDSATFDDEEGKRSPRTDLALALAAADDREAAITEAQHLAGSHDYVVALTGIALQDWFGRRQDDSAGLLAEVRSLLRAERFKPVETSARAAALSLLIKSGSADVAVALLEHWARVSEDGPRLAGIVVNALVAREDPDAVKPLLKLLSGEERVHALVKLATLQPPAAPSLLADAARQTEAFDVGITKVRLFVDVACASFAAGMVDVARKCVMRAWETNNDVSNVPTRPTPWVDIFTELVRYGEADLALRTMRQIPDDEAYDAVVVRCKIAEIAEESPGEVDPVELLEEAAIMTDAVTFPPMRDNAKQTVARGFAALGMTERALAEDLAGHNRAAVTAQVAAKLAALGHLDRAQQLLEGRAESLPAFVGNSLIRAFLKAGDLDRALRTADGMEDAPQDALLLIASALWDADRPEDAQRVARKGWAHKPSVEAGRCLVAVGLRAELTRWLQDAWLAATTPQAVIQPMGMLAGLLAAGSDLASGIADRYEWVSNFLQNAQRAPDRDIIR